MPGEFNFMLKDFMYVAVILIGAFLSYAIIPPLRRCAVKIGAVDKPDGKRKLQREPVPYFGGVAIVASFIVVATATLAILGEISDKYAIIAVGTVLMMITGVVDDVCDMKSYIKFFVQVAVALATVLLGGAIEYVYIFGVYVRFGVLSVPLTVLWIVLVVNSVNMMDGLDGLAGGISSFALMALFVTALVNGDVVSAVICSALCGATLGFLPHNITPASIFMGDAGSMSLGYVMAAVSVFGFFKGQAFLSIIIPAIILALPVTDAVRLFFVRISKGRNPFSSDRLHIHHILVDMGFSQRTAVLILYIISSMFSVAAIVCLKSNLAAAVIIAVALLILVFIRFLPKFKKKKHNDDHHNADNIDEQSNGGAEEDGV